MKNILTLISVLFSMVIFNSCCDCEQGRITDQLDTLRTLENAKKDLFYFQFDNGAVYKIKNVSKDSVDYGEDEEGEGD